MRILKITVSVVIPDNMTEDQIDDWLLRLDSSNLLEHEIAEQFGLDPEKVTMVVGATEEEA